MNVFEELEQEMINLINKRNRFYRLKRYFKYLYQRWTRGFDDRELWNLDITIAKYIHPRLTALRLSDSGYPSSLTHTEWVDILGDIETAMYLISNEKHIHGTEDEHVQIEYGLDLFRKYFLNLWT